MQESGTPGSRAEQSIYVLQEGIYMGPYTEKEVRRHWANGTIRNDDLLWHEGMNEWLPLNVYFGIPAPKITHSMAAQAAAPLRPAFAPPMSAPEDPGFVYQTHPAVSAGWLRIICWTALGASMLVAAVFHYKPEWVGLAAGISVVLALIQLIRVRTGGSVGLLLACLVVPAVVWTLAVALLPAPPAAENADPEPVSMETPAESSP